MTFKYRRRVLGTETDVDVYDVLEAFGVTCQATGHAVKKLLCAGQRGHKDVIQDLKEAEASIKRAAVLAEKRAQAGEGDK